jgi:hypothetical protein
VRRLFYSFEMWQMGFEFRRAWWFYGMQERKCDGRR